MKKKIRDSLSLTGKMYIKGWEAELIITSGNYALNGKPVGRKRFYLKEGDVIEDLDFKPPACEEIKWGF